MTNHLGPSRALPVETRAFLCDSDLNKFIEEEYAKGWIILTRFIRNEGMRMLYEYQRVKL